MAKIVIIGAGSHVFASRFITDIISYPELREGTITLMDIAAEPLALTTAFAKRIVEQNKFNTKIESTTDRRKALEGADYVLITIKVGGGHHLDKERDISLKYGLDQGDMACVGSGGAFDSIRHIPPILDICSDMEELCPHALLLNYTNPMATISWSISDYTKIKNVGLCHSVFGTAKTLAKYIDKPFEEVSYRVAGLNHFAWFLEFKWKGQDAYPLLREKFKNPAVYSGVNGGRDIVRAELFKTFGYYVTESSNHCSSYTPYFRKKAATIEQYKLDLGTKYQSNVEIWLAQDREKDEKLKNELASNFKFPVDHSGEYGSIIIHSIETGEPAVIYGNVKNTGLITNLTEGCCVEVPCLVDKGGIHPCHIGNLPPQVAALNLNNVGMQEMIVRGVAEKDKTKIFRAVLLDPLTAAVLTIEEIRNMVDDMFIAEAKFVKSYK
ncbi:MAG: alpha-galactosidase [Dehalococcoidales bacterium]